MAMKLPVPVFGGRSNGGFPASQTLEETHKLAHDRGYNEGYQLGQEKLNSQLSQIEYILDYLQSPYKKINHVLEKELSNLIHGICKYILMKELEANPEHIKNTVKKVVEQIVTDEKSTLHLNNEDYLVFNDYKDKIDKSFENIDVIKDNGLSRGECKMINKHSKVDMTIENILNILTKETIDE